VAPETRGALGIATRSSGLAADVLDEEIRASRGVTDASQRVNICVVSFQTIGDALRHARMRTVDRPEDWRVGPEAGQPLRIEADEVHGPAPDVRQARAAGVYPLRVGPMS